MRAQSCAGMWDEFRNWDEWGDSLSIWYWIKMHKFLQWSTVLKTKSCQTHWKTCQRVGGVNIYGAEGPLNTVHETIGQPSLPDQVNVTTTKICRKYLLLGYDSQHRSENWCYDSPREVWAHKVDVNPRTSNVLEQECLSGYRFRREWGIHPWSMRKSSLQTLPFCAGLACTPGTKWLQQGTQKKF